MGLLLSQTCLLNVFFYLRLVDELVISDVASVVYIIVGHKTVLHIFEVEVGMLKGPPDKHMIISFSIIADMLFKTFNFLLLIC